MITFSFAEKEAEYVDTPKGIFTAAGVWFHATEDVVRSYAAPVLERVSLGRLLHYAEVWLRSPETLALWMLPLFLVVASPLAAALATLAFYVGWQVFGPSFASLAAVHAVRWLDNVFLQGLYYVVVFTMLATGQQFVAVGTGLGGMILLRWGLVRRFTRPLVHRLQARFYVLPVPDQVLRAFLLRVAMKHRLSLPHLDRIEKLIMENLRKK